jgi:hypothetical protein
MEGRKKEEGSSATDSLSEDVTDVTDVRKKEESLLKLARPNAFWPNYQFPMTNNQFPKQIGGALRPPTN